jgi:hypothetical protein
VRNLGYGFAVFHQNQLGTFVVNLKIGRNALGQGTLADYIDFHQGPRIRRHRLQRAFRPGAHGTPVAVFVHQ